MSVVHPCRLLAILAAVFGAAAATAFRKLSLILLPFPAFVIRTLTDAASGFILATKVSHHNTCPILHVFRMMMNRELLHQGKDIEIVRQKIFVLRLLVGRILGQASPGGIVQIGEFFLEHELRNEMGILEIRSKIAVFGDVRKELQRHEDILVPRHHGKNVLGKIMVA